MRAQTRTNRTLGLNSGRERREAAGNREAISQDRRAEVFRQDVEHTGNAGDRTRKEILEHARQVTIAVCILRDAYPSWSQEQIARELNTSQANVSRILLDVQRGRRDPITGMIIKK